jgi:hypothetical protein
MTETELVMNLEIDRNGEVPRAAAALARFCKAIHARPTNRPPTRSACASAIAAQAWSTNSTA